MSLIFTKSELVELERQKSGVLADKQGIMSKRLRPKLRELLDVWFPKATELHDIAKMRRER